MRQNARQWIVWLVACAGAFVVAAAGGFATEIGPWYRKLAKPEWQPPDWVFGPAWTAIFALCAVTAARCWINAPTARGKLTTASLFALNGGLNVLWSVLFFALRRPDWALLQVGFLWLSIVALIFFLGQFYDPTRWLLLPYLVWVTFAAVLNASIVRMNAPFG